MNDTLTFSCGLVIGVVAGYVLKIMDERRTRGRKFTVKGGCAEHKLERIPGSDLFVRCKLCKEEFPYIGDQPGMP